MFTTNIQLLAYWYLNTLLQLTAEDEAFLAANASATLSQFEKVTANLGKLYMEMLVELLSSRLFGIAYRGSGL